MYVKTLQLEHIIFKVAYFVEFLMDLLAKMLKVCVCACVYFLGVHLVLTITVTSANNSQ